MHHSFVFKKKKKKQSVKMPGYIDHKENEILDRLDI